VKNRNRDRDQAPYDRSAATEQHGGTFVPFEPLISLVEVVRVDQRDTVEPVAQPFLAHFVSQPVERDGSGHRAGGGRDQHHDQVDPALTGQVTSEREHDLAGYGRHQVLQRDQ
jgi:hypothetical protein